MAAAVSSTATMAMARGNDPFDFDKRFELTTAS
jgi:hypothetical protein